MSESTFEIDTFNGPLGLLGVLDCINEKFGFVVERIYFIKNVPTGKVRGVHAHRKLEQIFLCLNGSFKVKLVNKFGENTFSMQSANKALHIPPWTWRELYDFSEDAICLVLASEKYDESDYIYNYDEFVSALSHEL
jgi:dTDP-4-dehydrorhamnose 3,5-epimerase-like enzyme